MTLTERLQKHLHTNEQNGNNTNLQQCTFTTHFLLSDAF